jgi:hypothetical protein
LIHSVGGKLRLLSELIIVVATGQKGRERDPSVATVDCLSSNGSVSFKPPKRAREKPEREGWGVIAPLNKTAEKKSTWNGIILVSQLCHRKQVRRRWFCF